MRTTSISSQLLSTGDSISIQNSLIHHITISPRGSTHGGHYFAYIKDVDALGQWTHPVRKYTDNLMDKQIDRQTDWILVNSRVDHVVACGFFQ